MTNKEIKQRYFDKKYNEAPMIKCACGCGIDIKAMDKYGRGKKFVNGHNGRKYEDRTQFKREWNHRNRPERYNYKQDYVRRLKGDLLIFKGGKCEHCGYKYDGSNACAFDMHHTDPATKLFNVGLNSFNRVSKEKNYKEAEKCIVLCAICHRLHHGAEF